MASSARFIETLGDVTGFLPFSPDRTNHPKTAGEVVQDAIAYMHDVMPQEEVERKWRTLEPHRPVAAVMGWPVGYPLSRFESFLAYTITVCAAEGLLSSPVNAVGVLFDAQKGFLTR